MTLIACEQGINGKLMVEPLEAARDEPQRDLALNVT